MEVCRLCLDLVATQGGAKLLDGETRDMVQVVAPELNLEASKEPHTCAECQRTLARLFEFKSRVFEREAEVRAAVGKRRGQFGLKEALEGGDARSTPSATTDPGGGEAPPKAKDRVCRTCLAPIECESFTVLRPSEPDAYLSSMLDVCLVEVDLELTLDPVMCEACLEQLQRLHHFRSACRDVEEKIVAFREGGGAGAGPVDLHAVLGAAAAAAPDVEMVTVKEEDEGAASSSRAVPRRGGRKRVKVEPAKAEPVKEEEEDDEDDESEEEEDDEDEDMSEGDEDDPDDELKQEELDIKSETGTSDSDRFTKRHRISRTEGDAVLPTCDLPNNFFRHFLEDSTILPSHFLNSFSDTPTRATETRTSIPNQIFLCDLKAQAFNKEHVPVVYLPNIELPTRAQIRNFEKKMKHLGHFLSQLKESPTDKSKPKKPIYDWSELQKYKTVKIGHDGKPVTNGRIKNTQFIYVYKCDRCDFQTARGEIFIIHQKKKHFKCKVCEFVTSKAYLFQSHKNIHSIPRPMKKSCDICGYVSKGKTDSRKSLQHHKLVAHRGTLYKCDICSKKSHRYPTESREKMIEHIVKVHRKRKCPECDYESRRPKYVEHHIRARHRREPDQVFECKSCEFETIMFDDFGRHTKTMHDENAKELHVPFLD